MPRPIRVLLVDDHPLVLKTVTSVLHNDGRFEVIDTVERAGDVAAAIARDAPDVVVLDLQLPDGDALPMVPTGTPAMVFSGAEDAAIAHQTLQAGAQGYVCKNVGGKALAEAVFQTAMGMRVVVSRQEGFVDQVNACASR